MNYIRGVFRASCDIIYLVEATDIDKEKWELLNNKIKEYEYQCA